MKIYIIACDSILRLELKNIIEEEKLGEVAGLSPDWEDACTSMQKAQPDVLLMELVPPVIKSMTNIKRIKERLPYTSVIVLSQVHDMGSVRQLYESGTEFLLHKPVDIIELRSVLRNMEMAKTMQWLLTKAKNGAPEMPHCTKSCSRSHSGDLNLSVRCLKGILKEIGILNEAGSKDIISIVSCLIEQELELGDITIRELCEKMSKNPKSVEQRIRRAAAEGMTNLAVRGMDDYADPVFNGYAGRLYSLEQVKKEMNYIRGKSEKHGNVRIRNFLGGLLECCREV